jgi:CRP/FNR family transcriptional regulator, cyclic AMP receptor protein
MQTVAFKAGDTIICEGDAGDTAFFIVTGSVEVIIGHGAEARTVGTLTTGEVFGEMSLIEPGPRSATVKALTDVECLAATYEEFIEAIERYPERAVGFMKTLVRRLRQMNDLLERSGHDRRGLRGLVHDCRKSLAPFELDQNTTALSWTMLW